MDILLFYGFYIIMMIIHVILYPKADKIQIQLISIHITLLCGITAYFLTN